MSVADSYIVFDLAGSAYGVRSDQVLHVEMFEHVTPVPNTAPAVEGVVFSRGNVVPAIDLRTRFGLPKQPPTVRTRLIHLKVQQRIVALIVDSAREFRTVPREAIRPIRETLHGIEGNYVQGVATVNGRLVLLLDVAAVLRVEETMVPAAEPALPSAS